MSINEIYPLYACIGELQCVYMYLERMTDIDCTHDMGNNCCFCSHGNCVSPVSVTLNEDKSHHGTLTATRNGNFVEAKIVYTDYDHYALIYTCEKVRCGGVWLVQGLVIRGHVFIF